ncbi:NAD(P)H-dependent oxidoreductase [Actinomycetes bacterium KLBMP 9797]
MSVVLVVGNPRVGSRTRALGDALLGHLLPDGAAAQVLELGEIVGVTFGPRPAYGSAAFVDPFAAVRSARLLVVATPAYKGSYTGLLKVFFDQFGPGALASATAVPVVVAASAAHLRSTGAALTALLGELGATVPVPPLSILESDLPAPDAVATYARKGPLLSLFV